MWLLYTLVHCLTMAVCNYFDEYLTHNNNVKDRENIHRRIGGVLLISTLFSVITLASLYLYLDSLVIQNFPLALALVSAVPMVTMWAAYFYLFQKYPAHQVVPLFGIASFWLLLIELVAGAIITPIALLGIVFLLYGAYVLDAGTLKWKIPTTLLLIMIPTSLLWAVSLFLIRVASNYADVLTLFFYQYVGIGVIGILLLTLVREYRVGFLRRIQTQGKNFLGVSFFNEAIAQVSFLSVMLAVSIAPLAVYVTALAGFQSIFLLLLFFIVPLHGRNSISSYQWAAIVLIVMGIFIIEFWK